MSCRRKGEWISLGTGCW